MNKRKLLFGIVVMMLSIVLACRGGSSPTETPEAATAPIELPAVLVGKEGTVEVAPVAKTEYAPAFLGMQLAARDNVKTHVQSLADIFCQDGTTQRVDPESEDAVNCKTQDDTSPLFAPLERAYKGRTSLVLPPREVRADYGNVPVILSPRNTKVLVPNPVVNWTPVDGAASYLVTLKAPTGDVAHGETTKTSQVLTFSSDGAAALEEGTLYLLSVEAVMGGGQENRVSQEYVFISVLSADSRAALDDALRNLEEVDLLDASRRFLLATLYTDYELYHDAIGVYEMLVVEYPEPAYLNALGDLYIQIKLNRPALEYFAQGADQAATIGDTMAQATAEAGLGRAYHAYGEPDTAREHFESSLALYEALGREEEVAWVKGLLATLP